MAKQEAPFSVSKADLKNYPLSKQAEFLQRGFVEGEAPSAEDAPPAKPAK